ncbi:Biotin_lipoyl_2 domain-containing protein [Gammaproteobacteria bacterium]
MFHTAWRKQHRLVSVSMLMIIFLMGKISVGLGVEIPDPPEPGFSLEQREMRAQLTPRRYTTLSSELGAKINQITVKEGEHFKAGQLLVKFDCALQVAQLNKARTQLQLARNTSEGNHRLNQMNAVGQVELKNSEAEVRKAQADVVYLQAMIEKCTIAAPFTGRVAEQKAREKQFIQAGQPLMDILDDSSLELEIMVPSRWLAWLKPGYSFKVQIDDTTKTYPVKLLRLGAKVDPVTQSIKATAVIDGYFPELIAGMSGNILITPKNAP